MLYSLIDQYENLTTVERDTPPTTVGWAYIVQGVHYEGRSIEEAECVMVRQVEKSTPYRGALQIAKNLGYHLVSLDKSGNMYIRSGCAVQGPFLGED